MKKVIVFLMVAFFALTGCDAVQKLAKDGMAKAQEAAENYVNKETGTGTIDDYNAVKGDKQKMECCLPHLSTLNKMADEQKITAEERDSRKQKVHEYYDEFKEGKIDRAQFDEKCKELTK
ncbi:MAG: hypothetical protein SCALA702_10220 [Melioribacteraceae bacterium]|nr:MAG: hypothetical protein SCALA702_10220 [Melioribacteraceae bacterium]